MLMPLAAVPSVSDNPSFSPIDPKTCSMDGKPRHANGGAIVAAELDGVGPALGFNSKE